MTIYFKGVNRNLIWILLVIFMSSGVPFSGSEEQPAPPLNPDKRTYRLSLAEMTELALINNFDIQLAQYDLWIKRTDQEKAESIYDTMFDAGIEYRDNQRRQTSTILGNETVTNEYNIGLSKKLPTGTTIDIGMTNKREATNSAFAVGSLTHDSALELTIKQELGKNFFGIMDRGEVRITQLDIESMEFTSLAKIEQNLADVQKAYWDLVLELERKEIEVDMVEQAKRLYYLHQRKFQDGLVEMPDLLASEANYQRRQNDQMLAYNRVQARTNRLKFLLDITEKDINIEPTEYFSRSVVKVDEQEALKNAFESRRDYLMARNDITRQDITLAINKNNIWPEINLTASMARNGLGDHFKEAVEHISDEDNPDLYAGLEFRFALENREAKALLKAAELALARSLIHLKLIERKVAVEVMDQVRDCNTYQDVALGNVKIARLQEQKLAEEEKRFQRGRSNTDILIRYQEDVLLDRMAAAQAKHRYHLALVDLQLKSSTLLDTYWPAANF